MTIYTVETRSHTFSIQTDAAIASLVSALRPGVTLTESRVIVVPGAEADEPAKAPGKPAKARAPKPAKVAAPAKPAPASKPAKAPRAPKGDAAALAGIVHGVIFNAGNSGRSLSMGDLVEATGANAGQIRRALDAVPGLVTTGAKRGTRYALAASATYTPTADEPPMGAHANGAA